MKFLEYLGLPIGVVVVCLLIVASWYVRARGSDIAVDVADRPLPPPVAQGRCVVDVYRDAEIQRRTCVHQGYEWSCASDGGYVVCTRGKEASGERVAP